MMAALLVATLSPAEVLLASDSSETVAGDLVTLRSTVLRDKIRGAWAGQTIGVTYGFPVEFKFNSRRVPDDREIPWYDGYLKDTYENNSGAYDDIYVDLTFVQVFEDKGLDAPAQAFADVFANADYYLWFANQISRYNVLHDIAPPQSGHWLNNPAADDIDFQIEADFAGIMNPGMVNSAIEVSDRIGHIMNYGDGWYGGVFIASMYSLAYISDDIENVVAEALSAIPKQSKFHQVISDTINLHKQYPGDWKKAWQGIHDKWSNDDLGAYGVMTPFNIDAKINAAWVVLGLLYGEGDFTRTLEIATRAGDDADCNPSSAAGILGTILGYDAIPDYWKQGLAEVEPIDFKYTTISLNDAYELSYKHALAMIERNGGSVSGDVITIKRQHPVTVPLEISFENHFASEARRLSGTLDESLSLSFDGIGFVLMGAVQKVKSGGEDHVFNTELYIDGDLVESADWPARFTERRFYLYWKYQLPRGEHRIEVKLLNPSDKATVALNKLVVFDNKPSSQTSGTN